MTLTIGIGNKVKATDQAQYLYLEKPNHNSPPLHLWLGIQAYLFRKLVPYVRYKVSSDPVT
jgi:hypothetical protein